MYKPKKRKGVSNLQYAAILIILILIAGAGYMNLQQAPDEQPPGGNGEEPSIPEFILTLIGENGTAFNLDESDFEVLTSMEMISGLMTSAGSIKSIANYTGVPISELCNFVGGINNDSSLRVTAADDYSMIFTWAELSGEFVTFNPVTGDEVKNNGNLVPCLAYFINGEPLEEGHGPLRMVVLSEEELITEGHYWIKEVVKVEVIKAVQEYTLNLVGRLNEVMDRATFESGANCPDTLPNHKGVYVDGDDQIWTGIPLWLLVGRIDDNVSHKGLSYNRDMAENYAYRIKVIAKDGYSIELNSSFIKMNQNILLANELDGSQLPDKYWPLRLVGSDLDKGQMIRNVATIELVYNESWIEESVDWGPDWNLTLMGYMNETMTRDEFITGATCPDTNHTATWTDGDGHEWTGIPLWLLVGRVDDSNSHGPGSYNTTLADEGYLVYVKASDGYKKSLDSYTVKHNDDLIIAYSFNGNLLPIAEKPEDTTYFPLRLVGPGLTTGQMVYNIAEIIIDYSEPV
jgi:DMSO/TMAO reductase YedYZ molybdopterin-dependent catalytic subunit